MNSRSSVLGRVGRSAAFLALLMLVAPLLLLLTSRSAEAVTLCLPKKDESACIAGTMGSRANPLPDVDVVLTKPDGSTETQTTAEDGKFAFTVTEPGNYLVGVDPDSLPKGSELRPPADAKLAGPDGALKVETSSWARTTAPPSPSATPTSTTAPARGRSSSSPASTASGWACCWPWPAWGSA